VLHCPEQGVKVSLRSSLLLPAVALVDPELTLVLPPQLTATTGLDALTQLIEPLVCTRANPLTDMLCRDGLERIGRSLRRAFRNGADLAAREDMALASLYSGMALANAGLGAVHGLAASLGGTLGAAHGALCAALLPSVMAFNVAKLRQMSLSHPALLRYAEIARVLTGAPAATAEDGIGFVRQLTAELQIPSLRQHGLQPSLMASQARQAAQANSMKANPVPLVETELVAIMQQAW
jgi:alcohol dehydrogenase class IV